MPLVYPTPFSQARAVTKSNTVNFDVNLNQGLCDALYIGGAGTLTVVFQDGSTGAFTCAAGDILPVRVKRVNNTGTAASIVALYSV